MLPYGTRLETLLQRTYGFSEERVLYFIAGWLVYTGADVMIKSRAVI